jgi:hypothetical protein
MEEDELNHEQNEIKDDAKRAIEAEVEAKRKEKEDYERLLREKNAAANSQEKTGTDENLEWVKRTRPGANAKPGGNLKQANRDSTDEKERVDRKENVPRERRNRDIRLPETLSSQPGSTSAGMLRT